MAPSQLAQLKAALNSAGLNRKSASKKAKKGGGKKGGAQDVDRAKKLARLDDIRARFNKFDERETKVKHDVGGRQLKGVKGKPTAAKSAGIEQRRQTLLNEHNLRGHRGTFQDRRFGENDPAMSLEDRMLERYTRERQRGQGRKGLFNLDDDDVFGGEEDGSALGGLTHGGRSVMDLPGDDFDAQGLGDDDDDDGDPGAIPWRQVARGHFGGFADQEEGEDQEAEARTKTKQEVMSEIIAKSKEHKLERQKQKEMDDGLREELDGNLDELRELLGGSAPVRPEEQLPGPSRTTAAIADQSNDVDYDKLVRSLVFEARAQPKDRTKTEDELALEEKERLELAEAQRLRRMRGEEPEEDSDLRGRKRRKPDHQPDADDLDDDFVGHVDDDGNVLLGPGLDRAAIGDAGIAVDSDGLETDEESLASTDDDRVRGSDMEDDTDDEDDDEDEDDEQDMPSLEDLDSDVVVLSDVDQIPKLVQPRKNIKPKVTRQEIPFTFRCPTTLQELEEILEPLDDSAAPTVVQRIRALHHPSLAQGNKEKLQDFLGVLLDYILTLASAEQPSSGIIPELVPHLVALVKLNALQAASHFITKLKLMQKNLQRGLALGPSLNSSRTFPRAPELVILRLVGSIWSTSDYSHPVVQPAMLLIGQYLAQSRIRGIADIASGLFLCSLVAQYESVSKRVMPEVINFLANAVMALVKLQKEPRRSLYPKLVLSDAVIMTGAPPQSPTNLWEVLEADNDDEQAKSNLLSVDLHLIQSFSVLYSSSQAFAELFAPVLKVLEDVPSGLMSDLLAQIHSTREQLARKIALAKTSREPLSLQDHKPIPIASYTPKFEDDFAPGKHYDPDAERNATAKLRAQYKKERKGAIRELRKDNRFLAGERAREQAEKDDAYNAKMRKAVGSLNTERAEEKEMEREKKRQKRRAGK